MDLIANDARHGLKLVHEGEDKAIEGWLIYCKALNEGREKFPGKENDRAFGEWRKEQTMSGNLPAVEH